MQTSIAVEANFYLVSTKTGSRKAEIKPRIFEDFNVPVQDKVISQNSLFLEILEICVFPVN